MVAESPPIDRIDIYTDGAWLPKGAENRREAGGYGVVMLEHRDGQPTSRLLSGPTPKDVTSNTPSELFAVWKALEDLRFDYDLKDPHLYLPQIVLHTDSDGILRPLMAMDKHLGHRSEQYIQTLGERLEEVASIMRAMNISITHIKSSHSKMAMKEKPSTEVECAATAHHLASQQAWLNRLEQQGYIFCGRNSKLTGQKAKDVIIKNQIISPAQHMVS